jgi:hypothetical protein
MGVDDFNHDPAKLTEPFLNQIGHLTFYYVPMTGARPIRSDRWREHATKLKCIAT